MGKFLLYCISLVCIASPVFSQKSTETTSNRYLITMYNLTEKNFDLTKDLLGRFTNATSVEFSKADSVFIIQTSLNVNKAVVSGKMVKNYVPIKYFILDGEPVDPYPTAINTGNPEQDALEYEKQKIDWIRKYPAEYKKMKSNK
ncbi:MAG: hypothetical protein V4580_04105 [Bacteroidota bacterium]